MFDVFFLLYITDIELRVLKDNNEILGFVYCVILINILANVLVTVISTRLGVL